MAQWPAMQETRVQSLDGEDPHSSILAGESCGQRSLGGYGP